MGKIFTGSSANQHLNLEAFFGAFQWHTIKKKFRAATQQQRKQKLPLNL